MSGTWDFTPLPLSGRERARIAALRAAHPEGAPDHCAACGVRYPCVRDPDLWAAATAAGEFVPPLHGRSNSTGSVIHDRPARSGSQVPVQEEK